MEIEINVPDGKQGEWGVSSFEVSEKDAQFFNFRAMFKPGGRIIKPGKYKKLTRNGATIMSNAPAETRDLCSFIWRVEENGGNILINGLGLGVALTAILKNDKVKSVTVIEKEQDVINLVGPTFSNDKRVTIIHANAFEWKPPKGIRYTIVWHDIWDDICADNLPEMTRLHRKYGRRTDWQDSWCRDLCLRIR